MSLPTRKRIKALLITPTELFAELFESIDPVYDTLSNPYYYDSAKQQQLTLLSDHILGCLRQIYACQSQPDAVKDLNAIVFHEPDSDLLCLSFLKALGNYLATNRKADLNYLREYRKIGKLILGPKSPNLIYDHVPSPVRKEYGTGMRDLLHLFECLTITREIRLQIDMRGGRLLRQMRSYLKLREENFKVAVTPFMIDMEFNFDSLKSEWLPDKKTPFRFKGVTNHKAAEEKLVETVLKPCIEKNVSFLVLPELMVDNIILDFLKDWLRKNNRTKVSQQNNGLLMVVAGSFHISNGKVFRNASTVLNHAGEILWRQDKLKRYSFDQNDIKKMPNLPVLLKTSEFGGHEQIEVSDTLCCADTPAGRICVCICIDFFHDDNAESLRHSGVNIFMVPAMTHSNSWFLGPAARFGISNKSSTFFANSGYIAKKKDDGSIAKDGASFYYLPCAETKYIIAEDSGLLIFDISS